MELLILCLISFLASGLTLFSGFGLGTLLLPVFALFSPLPIAVAMTAVVHFLNNLLKLSLFHRQVDWKVVLRFGIPALLASLIGAKLLSQLSGVPSLLQYTLGNRTYSVTTLGLALAGLLIFFALWEVLPSFQRTAFPPRLLALGGVLSGFFGGLSGHQGALRSAFLARLGLSKEAFIGTGVVLACLVDLARLPVYAAGMDWAGLREGFPFLLVSMASAFLGVYLGGRLLSKVTYRSIQWTVAGMILLIALGLGAGFW